MMLETDPVIDAFVEHFPRLFRKGSPRVMSSLPPGRGDLVGRLLADLDAMLDDSEAGRFEIIQIKEKFAGLRMYWNLGDQQTTVVDFNDPQSTRRLDFEPGEPTATFERIGARVRVATEEASWTRERCGRAGPRRSLGGG